MTQPTEIFARELLKEETYLSWLSDKEFEFHPPIHNRMALLVLNHTSDNIIEFEGTSLQECIEEAMHAF